MGIKLITAPETYPVSLNEAKAQLNVDFTDDDALITLYLKAATIHAEAFTGRAFIDQTWDYFLDSFPDDNKAIAIPKPPLIGIGGIYCNDELLSSDSYVVDDTSEPARISPVTSWPTIQTHFNAIRIRFNSGYVTDTSPQVAAVPEDIKAAILLIVGSLYENREDVNTIQTFRLPWGAEMLLRQQRIYTAIA